MTGTFARVWLVKLKDDLEGKDDILPTLKSNGQQKKVWAMKELRKADGELGFTTNFILSCSF